MNFVLSRVRVATIPLEAVDRLSKSCVDAIEFMLPRIAVSDARIHWLARLPVVVEALSRFVLRLDPEQVDSVFSEALGWYESDVVASAVGMAEPLRNLLSRSWEALPEGPQRAQRVLDLLSTPIVGMDGFSAGVVRADGQRYFEQQYPDPCDHLGRSDALSIVRTPADETRWKDAIRFLLRGLRRGGEARRRASKRISWLIDLKALTADEEMKVAEALWGEDLAVHSNLPTGTCFFDWGFLVSPEPRRGLAEQRFRAKWLVAVSPDSIASAPVAATRTRRGSLAGRICDRQPTGSWKEAVVFGRGTVLSRWFDRALGKVASSAPSPGCRTIGANFYGKHG